MSQRLYIGATEEGELYDCVLTAIDGAREKLIEDWLNVIWLDSGEVFFFGPWKIRIGDMELWKKVEPIVAEVFADAEKKYPDDVWAFYYHSDRIEHPTADELNEWIDKKGNEQWNEKSQG